LVEEKEPKELHLNLILEWCSSIIGPCEIKTKDRSLHQRSSVLRLQAKDKSFYLKLHKDPFYWAAEIHAYEQWVAAFGSLAPRLVALHEQEPLAVLITELPGRKMMGVQLTPHQERVAWHSAGEALLRLHTYAVGTFFGPCRRDGSCLDEPVSDPVAYLEAEFERLVASGRRANLLTQREAALVQAVRSDLGIFAGQRPVPCHRDYGPDNWLVTPEGTWAGLIDFEFSRWDLRMTDFSRYPNWEWMHRPDLLSAFFEGYGRSLTLAEQEQCLVTRTLYALGAVVWGNEYAFYGFEAEGRQALEHIAGLRG